MGIDWREKNSNVNRRDKVTRARSAHSDAEWDSGESVTWKRRPRKRLDFTKTIEVPQQEETTVEKSEAASDTATRKNEERVAKQSSNASKVGLFGRHKWRRKERKIDLAKIDVPVQDTSSKLPKKQQVEPENRSSDEAASKATNTEVTQPKSVPEHEKKGQAENLSSISASIVKSNAPKHARPRVLRRRPEPPRKKEKWSIKLLRLFSMLLIFAAAVGFYIVWSAYSEEETLPTMVMPQFYQYEEEREVRALLLWHEQVLKSTVRGPVQLAGGGQISTVAKNDVVATVMSRGKNTVVRAPARGYFVPALDGAEGTWTYGKIWAGSAILPDTPQPEWIGDLTKLGDDRVVGKLIFLPQNVRAIFYVDLTEALEKSLSKGTLIIRRAPKAPKWSAKVRVSMKYGDIRAKVVIDMPYFSVDMLPTRETRFYVCSEDISGLAVPETAVVIRNGAYGVYELIGDRIIFRKVTGKPISNKRFFISSGLTPGNPVIMDATNAQEKRVRLW